MYIYIIHMCMYKVYCVGQCRRSLQIHTEFREMHHVKHGEIKALHRDDRCERLVLYLDSGE